MARNANPYLALGVRPFINCCSVRTVHGGSLMLPQVRAAMAEASRHFVNLDELMEAASARLAELTGAEWGIVTCGSAAAVALGTAACVAGNDPVKMLRLPFTDGIPNRVIMPRNQRFAYDQAIRMIGTHIVEIDDMAGLMKALEEPVAMVALLGTHEHQATIRMEEIVKVVKPLGIPVLVDAASEHLQRPSPWLERGADLVVYSGGKFLRGPQTSGLLLGKKELVQAAWRNSSPHQALGRPMKVSKEDIVGLVTAVEYWFEERDHTMERKHWRDDLDMIARKLGDLATCRVVEPVGVERVPRLKVSWDAAKAGLDGEGLRLALMEGSPRVMLDDMSAGSNTITIDPFGFQPGEAAAVGDAIAVVLARGVPQAPAAAAAGVEVAGDWELTVRFLHGERVHRLHLGQDGAKLAGEHASPGFGGKVSGQLTQDGVKFRFDLRYEGSLIAYRFDGTVGRDAMDGTVVFGTSNDHHQGAVGMSQFGTGRWEARRVA
jgi:L-seryl-tRNA(Ser) seleniumtransferase